MSYAVKYRFTFTSTIGGQSTHLYKCEILQDGYTGSVNTVSHGDDQPLIFNRRPIGASKLEVIYGSTCELRFVGSSFDFEEFFAVGEFEYRVDIYRDSTLYWTGFVLPDQTQLEIRTNAVASIIASDGLEQIKEKKVIAYPNTNYGGKNSYATYFADMFKTMQTAITTFRDASNIRPSTVSDNVSLFNNIYLNIKALRTGTAVNAENLFTWNEFLKAVLTPIGCCIYQANGQWWITRVDALSSDYEYHEITISDLSETGPTSYYNEKSVNRKSAAVPEKVYTVDRSIVISADDQYTSQKVSFEYGELDTFDSQIIRDGDFAFSHWTSSTSLTNWSGTVGYERINFSQAGSTATFAVQINGRLSTFNESASPAIGTYLESFNMPVVTNSNATLDFSYYAAAHVPDLNPISTTIRIQLIIESDGVDYYYDFDTSTWSTSITYGSESGGGWQKYTYTGVSLSPSSGARPGIIKLRLIQIESTSSSAEGVQFGDIQGLLTIPETVLTEEEVSTSTFDRSIQPDDIELITGDTISQHYVKGIVLGPNDYDSPAYGWARRGVTEESTLVSLLANTVMSDNFYNKPTWKMEGTLKGSLSMDSVLRFNHTPAGESVRLMTTGVTHFAKSETWQGEWREIGRETIYLINTDSGSALNTNDGKIIVL